ATRIILYACFTAGCRYEGRRYQEGDTVTTSEPCLQCSCLEGSLRCRLRVCPRLPQPVPPGCRTRPPAENVCCSKLVCGLVEDENENILHRSNSAVAHHSRIEEGKERCRTGQRVYQEGEMVRDIAQKASCDNCFCAMGEIRCVPLSCAPPLQGCKPIVREGQCCPSTYNCSGTIEVKAAQNYASYAFISKDYAKFRKETNFYPAIHDSALGAIVEGRGHRIVNEVLESGDASSSSSGPLEISTEKFAMATESIPTLETETMNNEILGETTDYPKHTTREQEQLTATIIEFTESTDTSSFDQSTITARDSIDETTVEATSLPNPTLYLREVSTTLEDTWTETTTLASTLLPTTTTSGGGDDTSAVDENASVTTAAAAAITTTTTTTASSSSVTAIREVPESSSIIATAASTSKPRENCVRHGPGLESTSTDKETTTSINLKANTTTTTITNTAYTTTTSTSPTPTTTKPTTPLATTTTTTTTTKSTTAASQSKPAVEKAADKQKPDVNKAAVQAAQKKVDVVPKDEQKIQRPITVKKPSSGLSTSVIVPDDMLVMNVTVKTNVAVEHIHGVTINPIGKPDIVKAILNITNRGKGDDYELDYSQPTLPPSLPGVRIIPFVAADALVKDKDESAVGISGAVTGYPPRVGVAVPPPLPPELSRTDAANFYDIVTQENRFNPPKKTEGGFVPKDPTYYDPLFHPSSINLEIGTGVTVASDVHPVPSPHRKTDGLPHNCLYEEREYDHGQVLPSRALCMICICYYGEVVCSDRKCPPLKIGCKRVSDPNDKCCSKVVCVNGLESPTVVLSGETFQHEPTVSPDPFRDVIKTEPAPDLPSLIGAMMPYLVEHSLTTPASPVGINRKPGVPLDFDDYIGPSRNDTNAHLLQPSSASSSLLQHQPDLNVVRERNASSSSIADKISITIPPDLDPDPIVITQQTPGKPDEADGPSIFSGVLDLFFNEPSSTTITSITTGSSEFAEAATKAPPTTSESPTTRSATSESSSSSASSSSTADSPSEEKDSGANSGLLKLAGCNIYGRMYRVGMIISELSGACSECRCTEHGVECKNLGC
ncbi:hypothetical protein TSAR_007126, partial [Trichomalopsis sarcophagae]